MLPNPPHVPHPKPKRFPRREAVTIAAGFCFDGGVLVCADTQFSSALVKFFESKLMFIDPVDSSSGSSLKVMFAMSGTDGHMQTAVSKCERALAGLKQEKISKDTIKNALGEALVNVYAKHFFKHKYYGHENGPYVSLIIAVWWKGAKTVLLWTQETTVNEVLDFKCVGHGADMARFIVAPLLPQRLDRPLKDVLLVAIHALQQTKKADPYCGGESDFGILFDNGDRGTQGALTSHKEKHSLKLSKRF